MRLQNRDSPYFFKAIYMIKNIIIANLPMAFGDNSNPLSSFRAFISGLAGKFLGTSKNQGMIGASVEKHNDFFCVGVASLLQSEFPILGKRDNIK